MQLQVLARGLDLTDAARGLVERRVRLTLGRWAGRIERVHVTIAVENRSEGGVNKTCRIRVRLHGLCPVVVEQSDTDLRAAIERAADRAGRTVARRIEDS